MHHDHKSPITYLGDAIQVTLPLPKTPTHGHMQRGLGSLTLPSAQYNTWVHTLEFSDIAVSLVLGGN